MHISKESESLKLVDQCEHRHTAAWEGHGRQQAVRDQSHDTEVRRIQIEDMKAGFSN